MRSNNMVLHYIRDNNMIGELLQYSFYMSRISGLSIYNSAALLVQRPGIGFATSASIWEHKYNRYIKPGVRPLLILKPFGPHDIYYEACDTYSPDNEALPDWMCEKSIITSSKNSINWKYQNLVPILNNHGIYFDERELGVMMGGEILYSQHELGVEITRRKERYIYGTHYAMIINSKSDNTSKIKTIFHEIGHLLCGHLPIDEKLKREERTIKLSIPKRDRAKLTHEIKEYEAEKTCEFIMNYLGFEYDNSEYLEGYKVNGQEPDYDFEIAVTAADHFLSWIKEKNPGYYLIEHDFTYH